MGKKSDPCAKAPIMFQRGDISGALTNLKICKKRIQKQIRKYSNQPDLLSQLRHQLAKVFQFEGQVYFSEQNQGKAYNAFQSAKKLLNDELKNDEIQGLAAQIDYSMGLISLMRNQADKAMELFKSSKEQYMEANQPEQAVEVMLRVANINKDLGNLNTAMDQFEESEELAKKIRDKKQRRISTGRARLEQGRLMRITGEGNAEKKLKQAKKEFSKAKFMEGEANALIELSQLYEITDPKKAQDLLFEVLELGEMLESPAIQGMALTNLGVRSLKSGDFKKGQDQLLRGLKFRTEAGDKKGTAQTLLELSRITLISARNKNDLQKAAKFASQSLELYSEIGQEYGRALVLELLGSINTKLENIDEARSQIQEGKMIFEDFNDYDATARMLTQLAIVLDKQGHEGDTIPVLEKAIKIFEERGNKQGLAEALQLMGIQTAKSDVEEGISYLKESKKLYKEIIGDNKQLQVIISSIDGAIKNLKQN